MQSEAIVLKIVCVPQNANKEQSWGRENQEEPVPKGWNESIQKGRGRPYNLVNIALK